jgi:glyoxylase-like metal-dependent hydrolase (beta-lactamase superfamily II)
MHIESFFHQETSTFCYVVEDLGTNQCAIIDPALDYDPHSGTVHYEFADIIMSYIRHKKLSVQWILETHIHADHLTSSAYLKKHLGGQTAISSQICDVLAYWVPLFNISQDTPMDGSQFDVLLHDQQKIMLGQLTITVLHTPGHTPACASYLIGSSIFVGDTLLMPDVGTARTDFPGGSAQKLFQSIQLLYQLPEETQVFVGHDYPPEGRVHQCQSSIHEQKNTNVLLRSDTPEDVYIKARTSKDQGKPVPRLLFPSLQINLRGGLFGRAENNGSHYLKIPIHHVISYDNDKTP